MQQYKAAWEWYTWTSSQLLPADWTQGKNGIGFTCISNIVSLKRENRSSYGKILTAVSPQWYLGFLLYDFLDI